MNELFAPDRRAAASDLTRWLGPLSPAFVALAAAGGAGHGGGDEVAAVPAGASAAPASEAAGEPAAREPGTHAGAAAPAPGAAPASSSPDARAAELRRLFHALNNQLGVILTYAELLEAKATDEAQRARAAQIVLATVDALATAKALRAQVVK